MDMTVNELLTYIIYKITYHLPSNSTATNSHILNLSTFSNLLLSPICDNIPIQISLSFILSAVEHT